MEITGGSEKMNQVQFRENMGLLGLESTSTLSDRIFKMIAGVNNLVEFGGFIKYLDKSMHGNLKDKQLI